MIKGLLKLALFAFIGFIMSCSDSTDEGTTLLDCDSPSDYVFQEKDSILLVEFETGSFNDSTPWQFVASLEASEGKYAVWQEDDYMNTPGIGTVTFQLNIQNAGTYRFIWSSAVTIGTDGTEHNDSWLRFSDAEDFYGEKDGERVYPGDTGKTPNPNGSSSDGWFKVYRSGSDLDFKWQARTSDSDAHDIYVQFDSVKIYTMEVSARSSGHSIDQFVLFQEAQYDQNEATDSTEFSAIECY